MDAGPLQLDPKVTSNTLAKLAMKDESRRSLRWYTKHSKETSYRLGKTIGTGSYGKVKLATSTQAFTGDHRHVVAVKIINKTKVQPQFISKFLPREIEAMITVRQENIVKLYDVINKDKYIYIVMEYVDGGDLLSLIQSQKYLSEKIARKLFVDLVNGIEACHSLHVTHRDLKCENLLIDSQQRLKITDFGFASIHNTKNLSTFCGSYAYAAPELILGELYDAEEVDIWSMGIILYTMVVGKLPFEYSHTSTMPIESKLKFPQKITEDCKSLVRNILRYIPNERATISAIKTVPWFNGITVLAMEASSSLVPHHPLYLHNITTNFDSDSLNEEIVSDPE